MLFLGLGLGCSEHALTSEPPRLTRDSGIGSSRTNSVGGLVRGWAYNLTPAYPPLPNSEGRGDPLNFCRTPIPSRCKYNKPLTECPELRPQLMEVGIRVSVARPLVRHEDDLGG